MAVRPAPLVAAIVAVGLLAGCSTGASDSTARSSTALPAPQTATATPAATATPPTAGPPTASPTATASPSPDDDAPVLTLQGDGLGQLATDQSVAPLPFGSTGTAAVQQAVEDAMGATTEVPLPTCPQGPRTALQVDGFTVLLDGDSFVGWTDVGAPDRTLTTADGIGAGSRLSELQSAVPDVQVSADAGGTMTFASAGGLTGTLTGPGPDATISALSAGQTCPAP